MFWTFFRLVGKALRAGIARPIQRFNIESRAKKHLGEDAKYFKPAPRAIGAVSKIGPSQYPHLEGGGFKSIKQKRLEAIESRNQKLLEAEESTEETGQRSFRDRVSAIAKSFSETRKDDKLIIESLPKLPVIKKVMYLNDERLRQASNLAIGESNNKDNQIDTVKPSRPLPKQTNLDLSDPTQIWLTDKVPPGRISLMQLQELMLNKLSDENYWTPEKISETYNIKAEYAEQLTKYLKQVRIILSPRMAKLLDYTGRTDPVYQATKDVMYFVDKSLRTPLDKRYDAMYLPTDQIDPEIRELLDVVAVEKTKIRNESGLITMFKHTPLRVEPGQTRPPITSGPLNVASSSQDKKGAARLEAPTSKQKSPSPPPPLIPSQTTPPEDNNSHRDQTKT